MRVNAYAAPAAGEPLAPTTIERRDVGANDVLIEIEYAGICHSDIHTVNGDWGPQPFPVVPGHEIVGIVTEVGADVTRHQVGDRVGVGCMVNSCGECTNCRNGDEQYCLDGMVPTYAGTDRDGTTTQGGYSTHVVVDADYVLSVPDGIDPAAAAPLLCAGITTYAPLRKWGAGPGKKVAIVGLGGLGHMAVKIAHALGAEVTVLSQSLKKQEDGLRLGADALLRDLGPRHLRAARRPLRPHRQHGERQDRRRRLPRPARRRRHPGQRRRPGRATEPQRLLADRSATLLRRLDDRRHRPHPGDARLLRRAPPRRRGGGHLRRPGQRGVRAGARLRRALPLRHRRRDARVGQPAGPQMGAG